MIFQSDLIYAINNCSGLPLHSGSPEFVCLFSLFGRNLVANSMTDNLKPA